MKTISFNNDSDFGKVKTITIDLEMDDSTYRNAEGLSAHRSRDIITNPKAFLRNEQISSKELDFGRAVHFAVLECVKDCSFDEEKFFGKYAVAPAVNARTKAGKEELEKFYSECESKGIESIGADDYEMIKTIFKSVSENTRAKLYTGMKEIKGTKIYNEVPVFWEYGNRKCKAKIDTMIIDEEHKHIWICDLKTTQKADPENFSKSCANYGYGWQSAWYCLPWIDLGWTVDFFVVAVEKTEYADIGIYNIVEFSLIELGNVKLFIDNYDKILEKVKGMKEYTPQNEESILSAPRWFSGTKIPFIDEQSF